MIDRNLLIDRLLEGAGVPAGQMVGEGMGGYNPDLKPDAYDVGRGQEAARRGGPAEGLWPHDQFLE